MLVNDENIHETARLPTGWKLSPSATACCARSIAVGPHRALVDPNSGPHRDVVVGPFSGPAPSSDGPAPSRDGPAPSRPPFSGGGGGGGGGGAAGSLLPHIPAAACSHGQRRENSLGEVVCSPHVIAFTAKTLSMVNITYPEEHTRHK